MYRRFSSSIRQILLVAAVSASLAAPSAFAGDVYVRALKAGESYDRFLVRFDLDALEHGDAVARQTSLDAVGTDNGLRVAQLRRLAVGADVIKLDRKLDSESALRFMRQLADMPSVKYVEVDALVRAMATPNDPKYPQQWHYHDKDEEPGGINLPDAWKLSTGVGIVVAVLDTGITDHSEFEGQLVEGYDFVSDTEKSNDGDGFDDDPHDPGNAGEDKSSNWHGTYVAAIVAAATNNAVGVAGVAYGAKVSPVRVLGEGGEGYYSDIVDAIVWASGGSVADVPANANPAEVLNLSLGGLGSCGAFQEAIDSAVGRGAVIVASAGNQQDDVVVYVPAGCDKVIAVAASDRTGGLAWWYSNYGAEIDISAPGGDTRVTGSGNGVLSAYNLGQDSPGEDAYAFGEGTSAAAPHVAGVVALMQSVLVNSPTKVESLLESTARPIDGCEHDCGAGIIDAFAAVDAANKLANGVAETGLSASVGGSLVYKIPVLSTAGSLRFTTSGGSGNVDVYVNYGSPPTDSDYDYRSTASGNAEAVQISSPKVGTYYVRLKANAEFSGISLVGDNYVNGTDYTIWIGGTATSSIAVARRSGKASSSSKVSLDIKDAFAGDLQVDLLAPDGTAYRLNNAGDAGLQTYTLNLSSESLNGTWKLRVKADIYETDDSYLGYIDLWGLKF